MKLKMEKKRTFPHNFLLSGICHGDLKKKWTNIDIYTRKMKPGASGSCL
jgi:hypothetical protein